MSTGATQTPAEASQKDGDAAGHRPCRQATAAPPGLAATSRAATARDVSTAAAPPRRRGGGRIRRTELAASVGVWAGSYPSADSSVSLTGPDAARAALDSEIGSGQRRRASTACPKQPRRFWRHPPGLGRPSVKRTTGPPPPTVTTLAPRDLATP